MVKWLQFSNVVNVVSHFTGYSTAQYGPPHQLILTLQSLSTSIPFSGSNREPFSAKTAIVNLPVHHLFSTQEWTNKLERKSRTSFLKELINTRPQVKGEYIWLTFIRRTNPKINTGLKIFRSMLTRTLPLIYLLKKVFIPYETNINMCTDILVPQYRLGIYPPWPVSQRSRKTMSLTFHFLCLFMSSVVCCPPERKGSPRWKESLRISSVWVALESFCVL